jgi:hypothetical protein
MSVGTDLMQLDTAACGYAVRWRSGYDRITDLNSSIDRHRP